MYGCRNRPAYARVLPVQDGWHMDGYTRTPRMVAMPFRMSPVCNYTNTELGQSDTRCDGCKHKSTEETK